MYPLCVDLDGTLVRTDMLYESILALLKKNIFYIFLLPIWRLAGKASLKKKIAQRVELNMGSLPYDERVLELIRLARSAKRPCILITASDELIAQKVADHLKVFDEVIASNGKVNMKGHAKADLLISRFGSKKFDYAGDAQIDEVIWKHSLTPIVVNAPKSIVARWRGAKILPRSTNFWKALLKALRPHQYVKNTLIFVPLVTAHRVSDATAVFQSVMAFCAFSFLASSVYVLNDLLDLEADRGHPSKKRRPFAQGALPLSFGFVIFPILILCSLLIGSYLPNSFLQVLGLYFLATTFYSFYAKKIAVVDVILLAGLYTLRIVAGGEATGIPISEWMHAFSMFFFLSLAFLKRAGDLGRSTNGNATSVEKGRGYLTGDLPIIQMLGTTSGFLSVLVYALYINSADVRVLYSHPDILWLNCPVMLYGLINLWMISNRRDDADADTVIFAAKQPASYISIGLMVIILFLASRGF